MKYNKLSIVAIALLLVLSLAVLLMPYILDNAFGDEIFTLILFGIPGLSFLLGVIALYQIHHNPMNGKWFTGVAMVPGAFLGIVFLFSIFSSECGIMKSCGKGTDALAKSTLSGMRASAEEYQKTHSDFGIAYDTCDSPNTLFTDINIATGIKKIRERNMKVTCYANTKTWAVSSTLKREEGNWCVDSTGATEKGMINLETYLCE